MILDGEITEFFGLLQQWHTNRTNQLKKLIELKDALIKLDDIEIEPNTDLAKGLLIGVMLSLELLGKLPFSLEEKFEEEY
jgi:hypothetical protein